MKNEFILAFNEVLEEKQLPREVILSALEAAMVSAYRRAVNASNAQHVEAKVDPDNGKVTIFAEKEVVDVVQDERTEVSLEDARQVNSDIQLEDMIVVEATPSDFGRVAAQTARQVIQQRIREAERDSQMDHYGKQVGEIVNGVIQAITPQGIALGLDMKAEGILPRNQQVPGERFRVHDRIQALLLEVKQSPRGPQIILSRAHRNFLRRLLENEVPEIYHGMVEIRSIAREPGQRSKVAVAALQPAIDPVGACVGIRGVRIQAIVRELNEEKIDVIEWNPDPAGFIAKALSPARVLGVYLDEEDKAVKTAMVVVPEDQLSLAIGRDGQNARLAAKLTSWRIDIMSLPEATSNALHKLEADPEYAFMQADEESVIPQIQSILAKKAEGRPVTPEEYQVLFQFVDRLERGILRKRHATKLEENEQYQAIRSKIPEQAFATYLEDLPLSVRTFSALSEAGYDSLGSLMLQIELDSDAILRLGGIGPKALEEIKSVIAAMSAEEAEVEAEAEAEEEVEAEAEEFPAQEIELPSEPVVVEPVEAVLVEGIEVPEVTEPVEEEPLLAEEPVSAEITEPVMSTSEVAEDDLDQLFKVSSEMLMVRELDEEDEEDISLKKGKKAKKKKRKHVEMEYDPDRDIMIVKHTRKRGDSDWDENY
jgi:N utilization substance protein A